MKIVINRGIKEDRWFLVSFIIYTLLAFVPYFKSLPVVAMQMPIMVLSYLFLLVSTSNHLGRKYAGTLVFYSIIIVLFNFVFIYLQSDYSGATIVNKIGANYSLFVTSYPIIVLFSGGLDRINKHNIIKLFMIMIVVICITTIIGTFKYWAPCRELATPNNPELNKLYQREGIGGYGFIYFLLIVIPILLRDLKENKKVLSIVPFVLSIYCIIRAEYTTAIITALFAIVLCLLLNGKHYVYVAISSIVCILIYTNVREILNWAISFFEGKSLTITVRLTELLSIYQQDTTSGDVFIRQSKYFKSLNSFISNPFIGGFFHMGSAVGGHSEILDLLGHAGIVGIIVLIFVIYWIKMKTSIYDLKKDAYIKSLYIVALLIAIVNSFSAPELYYAILIVPVLFNDQEKPLDAKKE